MSQLERSTLRNTQQERKPVSVIVLPSSSYAGILQAFHDSRYYQVEKIRADWGVGKPTRPAIADTDFRLISSAMLFGSTTDSA
jgi:hypothetical protein